MKKKKRKWFGLYKYLLLVIHEKQDSEINLEENLGNDTSSPLLFIHIQKTQTTKNIKGISWKKKKEKAGPQFVVCLCLSGYMCVYICMNVWSNQPLSNWQEIGHGIVLSLVTISLRGKRQLWPQLKYLMTCSDFTIPFATFSSSSISSLSHIFSDALFLLSIFPLF